MTFASSIRRPQLRWMVRLEHARPSRFGERREGLEWTVTPYMARTADGRLIGAMTSTGFSSRSNALAYAHRQQRSAYGPRRAATVGERELS